MKTKICYRCKRDLPISSFSRNKATKDGYCCYCRECRRKYNRNRAVNKGYKQPEKLYAMYKGDEILAVGTAKQLAEWQGTTERKIRWHATPSSLSSTKNGIKLYPIEDMEAD